MTDPLDDLLDRVRTGPLLALTGAGVSAESGIPTFRGAGGWWTVGSVRHRPQELATLAAFEAMPEAIWAWYLYRRAICLAAEPNAAHRALVAIERHLGARYRLVTQNVDGLHQRAGSARMWTIHGDIDHRRVPTDDGERLERLPADFGRPWPSDRTLDAAERAFLQDEDGRWSRPHVLWFDECYDETHYRWDSTVHAAWQAELLLVAGTSGATTLPRLVAEIAQRQGTPILVIDPEPSPFSVMAEDGGGLFLRGPAGSWLPEIARRLGA